MVIHMIEKLTNSEILEVSQICDKEGIEEVFEIADNKGGTYWQGRCRAGTVKFRIEKQHDPKP